MSKPKIKIIRRRKKPGRVAPGMTFGRLTVLGWHDSHPRYGSIWLCKCSCGNTKTLLGQALLSTTKSCGCLLAERRAQSPARRRLYRIWAGIKERTCNPKNPAYANYGGRGIGICDAWKNSFDQFTKDVGPRPTEKHSIERIENNKGYEPGNCKWATAPEQAVNKRTSVRLTFGGKTLAASQWSKLMGLPPDAIHRRMRSGWDVASAISTPLAKSKQSPISQNAPQFAEDKAVQATSEPDTYSF